MQSRYVRSCNYCSEPWAEFVCFSAGCRSWILDFRACMAPVHSKVQDTPYDFDIENDIQYMLSWKYKLPHEYIEADPPLAPHHFLWLTGKRERRTRFQVRLTDSVDNCPRMLSCKPIGTRESDQFETMKFISCRSGPVTAWSMDGKCLWFLFPTTDLG